MDFDQKKEQEILNFLFSWIKNNFLSLEITEVKFLIRS